MAASRATGLRVSRTFAPGFPIASASNSWVRSVSWPVSARVEMGICSAPALSRTSGGLPALNSGCICCRMSVMALWLILAPSNFCLYSDSSYLAYSSP